LKEHASRRVASGGLRSNHQINVTVEHLQQGQHLIDGLAIVRLIDLVFGEMLTAATEA
jgi:hypothetical protein